MMTDVVSLRRAGRVAVLTIDNPPVNAMSASVRRGLLDRVRELRNDEAARAIVVLCAGRTFIAGADLKEFDTGVGEPSYRELFATVEQFPRPVIAALHGTALGAGAEFALACHYRCAVPDAKLGLPELTLGLIPGAGGTQRLPHLVGARQALEVILSATPVGAADAKAMGLIDRVITGDLATGAVAYAEELIASGAKPRPTAKLPLNTQGFDEAFIQQSLTAVRKKMRGQRAPDYAVEAVKAATQLPFEQGLNRETEIAQITLDSLESKALRHLFFAEREVARIPDLPESVQPRLINRVAIIGAGTMGTGIAIACADAGLRVEIVDANAEALSRGLGSVRKSYESSVARGRINPAQLEQRLALIHGATQLEDLADVDLVIEAVFEDIQLKKDIFKRLGASRCAEAILATNTSTLDLDEIAAASGRPQSVVGLHFFSPANVMRLLEIVRGKHTSPETLATALAIAKRLRKVGVVVGVCYGFVGNRMMLDGYVREADQLLLEGATPEQVDRVIEAFGFAMGPFKMNDMGGNDVALRARETTGIRRYRPSPYNETIDEMARLGRLGQKTGVGFYRYESGDRTPLDDARTPAIIAQVAQRFGIKQRAISDEEIQVRCVYPLINEGARILSEGIAYRSGDIDVIWTTGYGFPRFRGGPMFYADSLGLKNVYEEVRRLHALHGHYWEPAPLLAELAASGGTFAEWSKARKPSRS
jgi:3-hydroxyacyl-CoA dehydrogenase